MRIRSQPRSQQQGPIIPGENVVLRCGLSLAPLFQSRPVGLRQTLRASITRLPSHCKPAAQWLQVAFPGPCHKPALI